MLRGPALLILAASAAGAGAQDQASVTQVTSSSTPSLAPAAQPAPADVQPPEQLSDRGERRPAQPQLAGTAMSRQQPSQVASGPRNAEPPQPLSSPGDGRTAAVDRVEGEDRCDQEAGGLQEDTPECRDILEKRAADFERKRAELSPEQRLLLDRQFRNAGDTIADAGRRLADAGEPDSLEALGIASVVLHQPQQEEEKDTSAKATAEAIANFLQLPPPQ